MTLALISDPIISAVQRKDFQQNGRIPVIRCDGRVNGKLGADIQIGPTPASALRCRMITKEPISDIQASRSETKLFAGAATRSTHCGRSGRPQRRSAAASIRSLVHRAAFFVLSVCDAGRNGPLP